MRFGSTCQLVQLCMMLVGIWFGLYWVLSSCLDPYMQSSVPLHAFAWGRVSRRGGAC